MAGLLPTAQGAGEMIKTMRYLIGSRMYHNDVHIRDILRAQKDRVGNVLNLLDRTQEPGSLQTVGTAGAQVRMGHLHEGQVRAGAGQDHEDHQ
jgi:hypothetical protein